MTRDTSQNPNPAEVDTAEVPVITPPFGTSSVLDAPTASWASTPLPPRRSFVSRRPLVTTAIAALWIGSLGAGLWMGQIQSADSPDAAATAPTTDAPPSTTTPPPEETTTTTEAPPPTYYEDYTSYGTDYSGQYDEVPPPETMPPLPPPTTSPAPPPTTVPDGFSDLSL